MKKTNQSEEGVHMKKPKYQLIIDFIKEKKLLKGSGRLEAPYQANVIWQNSLRLIVVQS